MISFLETFSFDETIATWKKNKTYKVIKAYVLGKWILIPLLC
jgi:hypothetical protein